MKQREFDLKMKELKVSVISQRQQNNAENGSDDNDSWPQMASICLLYTSDAADE